MIQRYIEVIVWYVQQDLLSKSISFMPYGSQFEEQPLVIQFIKEAFNLLSPTLRYTTIWDTSEVLNLKKNGIHPRNFIS